MPAAISYVVATAQALDDLGVATILSGAATSVTSLNLINATANASPLNHQADWAYATNLIAAGQQRRVRSQGFTPSSGALLIYPDWTTPPTAGQTLYLTSLFPISPTGYGGAVTSYYALVNRALEKLRVPTRISIAITTDATYNLSVYPWIDRTERLIRMLEPAPISGRPAVDASWRNPRLVLTSGTPFLQMDSPFEAASGNLTLEVWRPGNTLINNAESTVGVTADGDTALPTVYDVREVALLEAFTVLSQREAGEPDGANWFAKAQYQQQIVDRLTYLDRTLRAPDAQPGQQPGGGQQQQVSTPQQQQDQIGGGVR